MYDITFVAIRGCCVASVGLLCLCLAASCGFVILKAVGLNAFLHSHVQLWKNIGLGSIVQVQ